MKPVLANIDRSEAPAHASAGWYSAGGCELAELRLAFHRWRLHVKHVRRSMRDPRRPAGHASAITGTRSKRSIAGDG